MVRRWGTVRGKGGPSVVMLSAVDGPPWTKCSSCAWSGGTIHGFRTWSGGTDCGGTIGCVTEHVIYPRSSVTYTALYIPYKSALDNLRTNLKGCYIREF